MRLALYGDGGFYRVSGFAGRRGDFITSPEVGPLFGAVIARAVDGWWREMGSPSGFTLVEAGAGPGTLARSIAAARPEFLRDGRYLAVEISEEQRSRHPSFVESVAELPTAIECGVVVANELLDNLPFRLFVFDGGWREAHVKVDDDENFVEVLVDRSESPRFFPSTAPHGTRLPLQVEAANWVKTASGLLGKGRVVMIDYCTMSTAELVSMPWREWLRTYRQQGRGTHYLRDVGLQDITTQVCVDQLELDGASVSTQRDFLVRHGLGDLIDEGRQYWDAHRANPDLHALTMRSRVAEADALCDPNGLGGFTVIELNVS